MILLCNTFITETPPAIGKGKVNRGSNLKKFSNFDIFKYSLASLSVIPFTKVILKVELDNIYKHRQDELESWIKTHFVNTKIELSWKRNVYQTDWIETYDHLDDRLIWFYCNHDHIFMESQLDYLLSLVDTMKNGEELCSLQFSHWPECIRTAKSGGSSHPFSADTYKLNESYISIRNNCFDSIQIITKELYFNWWLTGNFKQYKLPRPDYFGIGLAEIKQVPIHNVMIPLREQCRHFDGYQHCQPPILNDKCPAIDIPFGFFTQSINIRSGFSARLADDEIFINPMVENYFAHDVTGADYHWLEKDIPLFWKSKIKSLTTALNIDHELAIQYRLKSILNSIYYNGFPVDHGVEEKILQYHLNYYV